MQIIKLSATESTNLYLKNLMFSETLEDYTLVVTNSQTKGRGQMGAYWQSSDGKNLTFSVLKHFKDLEIGQQFFLNIVVSLAVFTTLKEAQIPDLKIKWPNDILSGNSKICGILIENTLLGTKIQSSVVGIGLNVNQTTFDNLPNASSLKLITGKHFDLEEILSNFMRNLKTFFEKALQKKSVELKMQYLEVLFRKDKVSTFENEANALFTGIIRNINDSGNLIVELQDEIYQEYDLKQIKLRY